MTRLDPRGRGRSGITLTEILISIMILGIGMVSLATLFPVGLLRIRAAQQASRSVETAKQAINEIGVRNLLDEQQLFVANTIINGGTPINVLTQDGGAGANGVSRTFGTGLPVAYDPLWWSLSGQAPSLVNFRFGAGSTLKADPTGGTAAASHGLQRITAVATGTLTAQQELIFASPDNPVTQVDGGPTAPLPVGSTMGPVATAQPTGASPLVPDLSQNSVVVDYAYSWLITCRQTDANDFAAFDGSIVVFNNRPFGTDANGPTGERVVEGVFAAGKPNTGAGSFAYSTGDGRIVQLRWKDTEPDPEVAVGNWLADVTYENNVNNVTSRATAITPFIEAFPEQRCYWYQVARRSVADVDPSNAGFRLMTVTLSTPVRARTLLKNDGTGTPAFTNAALLCPSVVNVFPRTFYNRR